MVKKRLFFSTALLLAVVFVIGVITGNFLSTSKASTIDKFLKNSELSTESYLIEQDLLAGFDKKCDLSLIRLSSLSNELWQLGKMLGGKTARQDLGEDNYNYLKRKYHLMQIKTYTLYNTLKRNCNFDENIVLYFYSANDIYSEEQGKILDQLVELHGIHVFALEFAYSPELKFVEDFYEISKTPTLIIDYTITKQGLVSFEELEKSLGVR